MIRIVFDFLWVSIVVSILLGLLSTLVPALGAGGGVLCTMMGALVAGQLYGRRTGAEATNGFAWRAALGMTMMMLVVTAVLVPLLHRAGAMPELSEIPGATLALGGVAIAIITLLVTRFFFRWGTTTGANSLGKSS